MAVQQNFRSAFNGFNREDVVHYIEYLNSKHTAEINQLQSEVDYLQSRVSQEPGNSHETEAVIEQQTNRIRELSEQNGVLEEELKALRAEKAKLETLPDESITEQLNAITAERDELAAKLNSVNSERDELTAKLNAVNSERDELTAKLEAASLQQTASKSRMEDELEAYRRAERVERLAKERANQMYAQANGVIADATVKVDEAATQISEMSETVMAQLQLLQLAVAGSTNALKDAAATMYTIRPESEE